MTLEDVSKRAADLFAEELHKYWSEDETPAMPPPLIVVMYFEDTGKIEQFPVPGQMGFLMESPRGKNIIFEAMRRMRAEMKPAIMAMAYDSYVSTQTDVGEKLGYEKFRDLANEHGVDWMFRNGYSTKREAVMATAQTADDVVVLVRPYAHSGSRWTWFGEQISRLKQHEHDGRTKIW